MMVVTIMAVETVSLQNSRFLFQTDKTILSLLATMRFKFYIKFLFNPVYFVSIFLYQDVFITRLFIVSMYNY